MKKVTLTIEKTGNIFSIAASEYKVTFPDGSTQTLWSPPWHEFDPEVEDAGALKQTAIIWFEKQAQLQKIAEEERDHET